MEAGDEVVIRPARADDVEAMVELLRIIFGVESDFAFDAARHRRALKFMLVDAVNRYVAVACCAGRIVGMCTAQVIISTAEGGPAAWVEDMVVAQPHRGRGVGRRLLGAIEQWAGSRGIRRLQLLADRDNSPALEFYSHVGWTGTKLICLRRVLG